MTRRVVVTGMGAITPLGNDLPTTWAGIVAGRSGVGPITRFDATEYRSRIAAEVKNFDPTQHFPPKEARRMDPFVQYALVAAREAVRDAGLTTNDGLAQRTAVIIGSGIGGIGTVTEQTLVLHQRGPSRVSPFLIPMILPDTAAGMVALEFGFKGPNMAITSACASGANAIGEAYEMVRRGAAEVAICGGAEAAILRLAIAAFNVGPGSGVELAVALQAGEREFDRTMLAERVADRALEAVAVVGLARRVAEFIDAEDAGVRHGLAVGRQRRGLTDPQTAERGEAPNAIAHVESRECEKKSREMAVLRRIPAV